MVLQVRLRRSNLSQKTHFVWEIWIVFRSQNTARQFENARKDIRSLAGYHSGRQAPAVPRQRPKSWYHMICLLEMRLLFFIYLFKKAGFLSLSHTWTDRWSVQSVPHLSTSLCLDKFSSFFLLDRHTSSVKMWYWLDAAGYLICGNKLLATMNRAPTQQSKYLHFLWFTFSNSSRETFL